MNQHFSTAHSNVTAKFGIRTAVIVGTKGVDGAAAGEEDRRGSGLRPRAPHRGREGGGRRRAYERRGFAVSVMLQALADTDGTAGASSTAADARIGRSSASARLMRTLAEEGVDTRTVQRSDAPTTLSQIGVDARGVDVCDVDARRGDRADRIACATLW